MDTTTTFRVRTPKGKLALPLSEVVERIVDETYKPIALGSGSNAIVYKTKATDGRFRAVKIRSIANCDGRLEIDSVIELIMLRYLRHQYIDTRLTPHLLCIDNYCVQSNKIAIQSNVAECGNLWKFINVRGALLGESTWRVFIFQLVYTLSWIEKLDPNFRHNDLHLPNVFVQRCSSEGYTRYTGPEGGFFFVPNVGYRCLISDFDAACIVGKIDNPTILYTAVDKPSWGMTYEGTCAYDLYRIVREMMASLALKPNSKTASLEPVIDRIWGEKMRRPFEYVDSPRVRPSKRWTCYPRCQTVLRSLLFDCFKSVHEFSDAYGRALNPYSLDSLECLFHKLEAPYIESKLPEFMFGSLRADPIFAKLPSNKFMFQYYFSTPDSSLFQERALHNWVDASYEKLSFVFPCDESLLKDAMFHEYFQTFSLFLGLLTEKNATLLAACVYFCESPRPSGPDLYHGFQDVCYDLGVYSTEAVLLQYSWLKWRVGSLGMLPSEVKSEQRRRCHVEGNSKGSEV